MSSTFVSLNVINQTEQGQTCLTGKPIRDLRNALLSLSAKSLAGPTDGPRPIKTARKPPWVSRPHRIRRTPDGDTRFVHHVSIDHRCLNILMPQQFLHRADICPALQKMSCKTVA